MSSALGTSLAKVTIETPKRSMDVALPEDIPVAELVPYILRHAGDGAADDGERHGGWVLRRMTGESVDSRKTLGAQEVLDGEVLHLVPGQSDWPELEYDDIVESIASGARRYGRSWGRAATRRCGLGVSCAVLLAGTLVTFLLDPPWLVPGLVLLAAACVLMSLGIAIARAVPDATAGAVFAGCSLPYGFLGGGLLSGPSHAGLTELGAPQLLLGSVTLLVLGVVGYIGIGVCCRVFVAAIAVGVLGAFCGLIAGAMAAHGVAALAVTIGIGGLPGYPLLALRLGRVPLPALPQRASEFLENDEPPPASTVFAAASRTDEILTGLLIGVALVSVVCGWYLAVHGGSASLAMLAAVAVALLLRGRLFAVPRHRVPLLVAGVIAAVLLVVVFVVAAEGNGTMTLYLFGVLAVAALISAAGVVYSKKNPSPYLGRFADIVDVLAILTLIPLACYLVGFYTYVRGVMAGIW